MAQSIKNDIEALLDAQIMAHLACVAIFQLAKRVEDGYEGAGYALAEAESLLRKVWELVQEFEPANDSLGSLRGSATRVTTLNDQVTNLATWQFKTNELVHISGAVDGHKSVRISGLSPIDLGKRAFLVLKVLACHARDHEGAFMTMPEILSALSVELETYQGRTGSIFWTHVVPDDVHRTVNALRRQIENIGGSPLLIESSRVYGGGYRLSTPCGNILIEDLDDG